MKNRYALLLGGLLLGSSGFAQFSDNFDSYTAGGYLGVQSVPWTTWSGTQGGAEDVLVSSALSHSAPNSIYYSSTSANGGPTDCVLSFGGVKNTGQFSIGAYFYVQSGKGAYFNLQADATIGATWALDCQMVNDGNLYLSNTQGSYLQTTYPIATWFELRLDINLNTNVWELFIDNVSQGSFANPINRVSFIDIFPINPTSLGGNNQAGYYMDDFFYNHTPYSLPSLNGAVTLASVSGGLAGQNRDVVATVRNLGTTAITSFDITYDYNGSQITENVTGQNLASLATMNYTFNQQILLAAGSNPLTITISNVNGAGADGDANDDAKTITLDPVVPAAGKMVVAEEGTGTWCGWCPRGAVYMEEMSTKYDGYFAGVAVHNSDPMTVTDYDAAMGGLISGYPSALVDRGAEIDPSQMEGDFLNRIILDPAGTFNIGGTVNGNALTVDVTTTFHINTSGDWRLLTVLTEDGITGTTSGYNQTNYYSSTSQNLPLVGAGHNWQTEPNPVPAANMVYDHVARDINPSFTGLQNAFTTNINANDIFSNSFNFTLDPTWDVNAMHIVVMLRHPNGTIENAGEIALSDLITGVEENSSNFSARLYPNPASDFSNVAINISNPADVNVEVIDINGKVVSTRAFGTMRGEFLLPVNTSALSSGIYLVNVRVGNELKSIRLIKQ